VTLIKFTSIFQKNDIEAPRFQMLYCPKPYPMF